MSEHEQQNCFESEALTLTGKTDLCQKLWNEQATFFCFLKYKVPQLPSISDSYGAEVPKLNK